MHGLDHELLNVPWETNLVLHQSQVDAAPDVTRPHAVVTQAASEKCLILAL